MSHEKRPDPFTQAVGGCLVFLTMLFLTVVIVTWLTPG